jgi:NACalpha-BTF3-like transcription factor
MAAKKQGLVRGFGISPSSVLGSVPSLSSPRGSLSVLMKVASQAKFNNVAVARKRFQVVAAAELAKLLSEGFEKDVAGSILLRRIRTSDYNPPEQLVNLIMMKFSVSRDDAMQALIVKHELKGLNGGDLLDAIDNLTEKLQSTTEKFGGLKHPLSKEGVEMTKSKQKPGRNKRKAEPVLQGSLQGSLKRTKKEE